MEKVKNNLENLKNEIEADDSLKSNEASKELLENINPIIEEKKEITSDHHKALVDSLNNYITQFEASHPKLAEDIRMVINSLNEIGI